MERTIRSDDAITADMRCGWTGIRHAEHVSEKSGFGAYRATATCPDGHVIAIAFALPDRGDCVRFYQCSSCGSLVGIDPDAEYYIGPEWDVLRSRTACQDCGELLEEARAYPDHFRCPECGVTGSFDVPETYPPDGERCIVDAWNPYRST
jgi:predicted RNA-binding Zn-ribbon protein involved in translation (DUF1610 family)